jgi:hypothetical protein
MYEICEKKEREKKSFKLYSFFKKIFLAKSSTSAAASTTAAILRQET